MQKTMAKYGKTQHATARRSAPPLTQSPSRLAGLCVAALISATISAPSWGQIEPDVPNPTETVEECCDGYVIISYNEGYWLPEVTGRRGWVFTASSASQSVQCAQWSFYATGAGADIEAKAYLWDHAYGTLGCSGEVTPLNLLRKSATRFSLIRWTLPCSPQPAQFRFRAAPRVSTSGRIDANNGWWDTGCGGLHAIASVGFEFSPVIDPAQNRLGPDPWPGPRAGMSITSGGYCERGINMTTFAGSGGVGVSGSWTWSGDIAAQPINVVLVPPVQPNGFVEWVVCAAFERAVIRATGNVEFYMSASGNSDEVAGTAATSTVPDMGDRPVRITIEELCSTCTNPVSPSPFGNGGPQ